MPFLKVLLRDVRVPQLPLRELSHRELPLLCELLLWKAASFIRPTVRSSRSVGRQERSSETFAIYTEFSLPQSPACLVTVGRVEFKFMRSRCGVVWKCLYFF